MGFSNKMVGHLEAWAQKGDSWTFDSGLDQDLSEGDPHEAVEGALQDSMK